MLTRLLEWTLLLTFAYYLFARAEITRWLWSRYPRWLDSLARCAACTGFWLGLFLSFYLAPPTYGAGARWERALWGAVYGLIFTPIGAAVLLHALDRTHIEPDHTT